MQTVLILFFTSLAGIVFMIGRKIFVLEKGQIEHNEESPFELPDLGEVKQLAVRKTKRYGYTTLVVAIRLYVLALDYVKTKGREVFEKAKDKILKSKPIRSIPEKHEVSRFLKMVSDYKQKIKNIKHRIKEEEGIE